VYATTSENDGAAERTNIFGAEAHDTDFDVGDSFTITQSQESGTPPPPNGPSSASAKLWSRSGVTATVDIAQGNHLFSSNASEQSSCTFAGFAVVGGV
jgi:hypothetical protein